MKAHVEFSPGSTAVRIYVVQEGPSAHQLWRHDPDGEWTWRVEQIPHGESLEAPSITMPREMLEAIVAAASDVLPPSAATDRHLDDAMRVRDRLLALVEELA